MPETPQIVFSYQELAEVLVKQQDLHEGFWGLYFEFDIAATFVSNQEGDATVPAAVVPVQRIGIRRFDEEIGNLTVDAAVVNPAPNSRDESGSAQ
jgi:hypothetical protein